MKRAQKIRLGIFITVSAALLLVLIGYFTARGLFERKEQYFVAYHDVSVAGLEVGSPVKYMGINVGSIADIKISPVDFNVIIVELSLQENTKIKEDAEADIVAMGITGLRTIEIKGGTEEADFLEPGDYIQPGTSFAEDITGKAEDIYFRLEEVLNNLQVFTHPDNMEAFTKTAQDISRFTEEATHTVSGVDELIAENRQDIRESLIAMNKFTSDLDKTSEEMFFAVSRFNEIMQGDTLAQVLGNFQDLSLTLKEANLNELITQLAEATAETQLLLRKVGEDIDKGSEILTDNIMILQYTLNNIHEVSRKVNTNPSVLIRRPRIKDSPDQMLDDE